MIKTRKMMAIMILRKMYILNDYEDFRGDYDEEIQKLEKELREGVYDKEYD